ncbi:MAG: TnsA endonuclease N-terminal domain-containing protein [Acidobacteria bacterium]|nr:TnsA endonuclease N-terminal domain-containing protein [Acidobacteriota bacterium]
MERNVIDCLEQADLTWRYYEQPVSIIFKDERFKSREFTPDLLWYGKPPTEKYKRIRPVLIEVKPVRQLFAWGAMNRERVDAAKLEADRQGWQFVFVTDGEIRPPEALIHWLNSQVPVDMDPLQVRLIDFLDQVGPTNLMSAAMHLKGLVGGLEPASDVVGRLISEGIIEYIDREPVTWWSKIQLRGQTLAELATAAGKVSHD